MSLNHQVSHQKQMSMHVDHCKQFLKEVSINALQLKLEQIIALSVEFQANQGELEDLCDTSQDLDAQISTRSKFNDQYYFCYVALKDRITELEDAKALETPNRNAGNDEKKKKAVKLPTIELSPYNGNYEDWATFHDLFHSLIHTDKTIADVQKLHYLKSIVKDEAETLIKSIPVTEANYAKAWDILKNRYDHKRFIVDSLLKSFLNQPKIANERHSEIKKLIDKSTEIVQALQLQGIPVQQWDAILVHIVVSKLDEETHKQWELKQTKDRLPTFKELEAFLQSRWQSLEMSQKDSGTVQVSQNWIQNSSSNGNSFMSTPMKVQRYSDVLCSCCKGTNHKLYSCPEYNQLSVAERKNVLKAARLCYNCLSNGHTINECTSLARCKNCRSKHHSSIHMDYQSSSSGYQMSSSRNFQDSERKHTGVGSSNSIDKRVLLATAVIYVHASNGTKIPAKALIDNGSTNAIIRTKLAKKLGLHQTPDKSKMTGLGDIEIKGEGSCVFLRFSSTVDASFSMEIEANVMDTIAGELPSMPIHREEWPHLNGIKFADPHFDRPSEIEVLLGAETFEEILLEGIVRKVNFSPTAVNSRLGWLLFGSVKNATVNNRKQESKHCLVAIKSNTLDETLRSFWEMEEVPEKRKFTVKEQQAEASFVKNVHRNHEGRYVVALPFDPDQDGKIIGESRKAALCSLFRMESRFRKDNKLKTRYSEYIKALIDSKHIELVPQNRMNLDDNKKFYFPHHSVIKEESLTTKLRVVFDASRSSSTGVSLNDKLLVGPKTQEDLFSILIRWRKHRYVILADAEKMYRQIKLIPEHRDYQRMLWRFEENGPILEFRITTVIDGTASASFLATRVLRQLAEDQSRKFPEASNIIKEDFYMDDMSSGSFSIEKTKQLQNDIIQVMKEGKFNMRKWLSNSKEILENVPMENRHDPTTLVELIEKSVKTLGVYWNPLEDSFEFKITAGSKKHTLTKRELLSDISQLFDPIGWLAPCTIMAKIIMQSLWTIESLKWDDRVPEERMKVWRKYREELQLLEKIKIPRWIGTTEIIQIQLHGFGDASNAAYAAVIFSRVIKSDGTIEVKNLSAKTKVSPIKTISSTKLELCGSVLLSRLMNKVKESLKLPNVETFAYCDNMTVLAWINSQPNNFNVFVANRITEIQNLTKNSNWSFVSTVENPADCASRGIYPSELVDHKLWWNGPDWLAKSQNNWPSYELTYETDCEKKKMQFHTIHVETVLQDEYLVKILKRHSTLSRLLWNSAYVTKFCSSTKSVEGSKIDQPNARDLKIALVKWTKYIQRITFKEEIDRIAEGENLLMRSKLIKLNPFIDENGLLRVGGRLSKSELFFDAKHPIILPKNNHFTKLIIEQAHKYTLHGGPTLISTFLQNYWIFCRSTEIEKVVVGCVTCYPHRCKPAGQIMADLPPCRVKQSRSFSHAGLDFAGPIITKTYTGRSRGRYSNPTQKSYICIFVCMATKAVHVELVSDESTVAFIACLKRFVSRRGKCTDLYSDNGKNFEGANNELSRQFKFLMKNPDVQSFLAHDGIIWHFNPPLSPNFGGLWEAGVKSIKYHLKRLAGNTKFTFEELTTLLCQIEACLNSRPLCAISNDVNDTTYLTPGHFLIGDAPIAIPEISLLDESINRLSRWKLVQYTYQQFWKIWHKEYLSRLNNRPKWFKPQENVRVGQLVLLRDEGVPPTKWPVARILKVHPDDKGNVRVVTLEKHHCSMKPPVPKDLKKYLAKLKTHKSVLTRPVSKISVLPIDDNVI